MLLVINLLVFAGALVLIAAAVAWWKVLRFPTLGPEAGRRELDLRRIEVAAMTTATAFVLCAVAAILAVVDWFAR